MPTNEQEYKVVINRLRFLPGQIINTRFALYECELRGTSNTYRFKIKAKYDPSKRHWVIHGNQLRWLQPVPSNLYSDDNISGICNVLIKALQPTWFRPLYDEEKKGCRIQIGQCKITRKQERSSFLIARFNLLTLSEAPWDTLWEDIYDRVRFDPEFRVQGFRRRDIQFALNKLKHVYPWEWVKSKYKRALENQAAEPQMNQPVTADYFFPAYHLARTSMGAICKDTGWNYIMSLAQALKILREHENGDQLIREVTSKKGAFHQAIFSKYIADQEALLAVNQPIGSGSKKHDILAQCDDRIIDIEMKVLSSIRPAQRLKNEIRSLDRVLPRKPNNPIVFYTVLAENAPLGKTEVNEYMKSIDSNCFGTSKKISAIVVGKMFVDSRGGCVDWDFDKYLVNTKAQRRITKSKLRQLFRKRTTPTQYPILPMAMSFQLDQKEA